MFRPTIFKISLAFIILGIVWIGYTTIQSEKISENFMIRSTAMLSHLKAETTIIAVSDRTGKIKYWYEET